MTSKRILNAVFDFFTSFFGWGCLGVTISSITNNEWVVSSINTGLWNICSRSGGGCFSIPSGPFLPSSLLAVRAFSIMSAITIFIGGCVLVYSQCRNNKPTKRACSVLYFLAGIFGIISMAIYTSNAYIPPGTVSAYYGAGFIMGWVGCLSAMCAGFFGFLSYKNMDYSDIHEVL